MKPSEPESHETQVDRDFCFDPLKKRLLIRITDCLLAFFILILFLPVMFLAVVVIFWCDRLPVFFRQVRPGFAMKDMTIIKFRTMEVGAELQEQSIVQSLEEPNVQIKKDKRVTPIGKVLRKFSIDELPQLFLVITGDMSLVGPRPLIKAEVDKFPPRYLARYRVPPGITGLAQVSGRGDLSVWEILELDLEWVENYSFSLYLKILWQTIFVVFKLKQAC